MINIREDMRHPNPTSTPEMKFPTNKIIKSKEAVPQNCKRESTKETIPKQRDQTEVATAKIRLRRGEQVSVE